MTEETKSKKSIWRRWWFVVIIVLSAIYVISIAGSILVALTLNRIDKTDSIERVTNYFIGTEWKEFHSITGQFKVYFPSYPEHETTTLPTPLVGEEFIFDSYNAIENNGTDYMVGVARYPFEFDSSWHDYLLEGGINGAIASFEGNKLISSEFITFRGHKAVNFSLQNKIFDVEMKGIFFLRGQNLYELIVVYSQESYNESDYEKFINSFQLL